MSLQQHVNASGFPLQLAIANLVKRHSNGWTVLYEEHAWRSEHSSGFIDLVLEDRYKTWLMNIECKRVRDADWIFLCEQSSSAARRHAKLWVTHMGADDSIRCFDWVDIPMDPPSPESHYCVVPGQDQKSRPMLERTAASVVESTEALALEEARSLSNRYSSLRIYQNVIVTTAALHVCEVDVDGIDMATGELGSASAFKAVPFVRFRKQLGVVNRRDQRITHVQELRDSIKSTESTVFVVNAAHFSEFLQACELPDNIERYVTAR